ncbi:MAG: 2-C-methyl-D-erythritol 4-phosphate cytidylyltransferase [Actinomycetota bacterium]
MRLRTPAAIVVAGGSGRRAVTAGDETPKQFRSLGGRALFEWSIDAFKDFGCDTIVLVVPASDVDRVRSSVDDDVVVVEGGKIRQHSVANGLVSVKTELVLVHDAARPFVDQNMIARVVDALSAGADAVIPCVAVNETIKEVSEDVVLRTVNRERLCVSQTPQGFTISALRRAHEEAASEGFEGTDDAQLVERSGGLVRIVDGSSANLKITTSNDLDVAAAIVRHS